MNQKYDVIILGAGAAGMMCAIEAGKRSRRVLVLERADRIGKKILISGAAAAISRTCHHFRELFRPITLRQVGARPLHSGRLRAPRRKNTAIPLPREKLGQLFCDRAASDITAMLEQECRDAGVEIRCNTKVHEVHKNEVCRSEVRMNEVPKNDQFTVQAEDVSFSARAWWVATGGLSIAKIGATFIWLRLARQFGLKIVPPRAALVPLVSAKRDRSAGAISPVSRPRWLFLFAGGKHTTNRRFRENMLFTHRGISGPAVLRSPLTGTVRSPFIRPCARPQSHR